MKLIKQANGQYGIQLTREEWLQHGKRHGWDKNIKLAQSSLWNPTDEPDYGNEEPKGPGEEDITIVDKPMKGYDVGVVGGKFIGNFTEWDNVIQAVKEYCNKNQFWPDVWHINDHGNADIVSDIDYDSRGR